MVHETEYVEASSTCHCKSKGYTMEMFISLYILVCITIQVDVSLFSKFIAKIRRRPAQLLRIFYDSAA